MTLKSFALGSFATTAIVASSLIASAPAEAVTLAPGAFTTQGTSSVTEFSGAGDTDFTLNFNNFSLTNTAGVLSGTTGNPVIESLNISGSGGAFTGAGESNFVTGLFLNGTALFVDLDPFSLSGNFTSSTNYSLNGILSGQLRSSDGSVEPADITLGAFNVVFDSNNQINAAQVGVSTEIPTPALLPGLIGMGVAALRKRKSEALDSSEA